MPKRKGRLLPLREREDKAVELAFEVQDPCGDRAIELAQEVLRLIHDRDDVTCCALASEMRILCTKYPRGGTHESSEDNEPEPA